MDRMEVFVYLYIELSPPDVQGSRRAERKPAARRGQSSRRGASHAYL